MFRSLCNAVGGNGGSLLAIAAGSVVAFAMAAPAEALPIVIRTNDGNGADAEVRESESLTPDEPSTVIARGIHNEIATRVFSNNTSEIPLGNERNSVIYLRFDISGLTLQDIENATDAYVQLHVGTTSWNQSRSVDPQTGVRAGFALLGLNPNAPGQDWLEGNDYEFSNHMAYANAPGLTQDRNAATKDYNPNQVRHLATVMAPDITAGSLPVGTAIDFNHEITVDDNTVISDADRILKFLKDAINAGNDTVTFLIGATQDGNPLISGGSITNYNYVFVPKDRMTLPTQGNVDLDGDGVVAEPSPWSGASNANGEFSPKLIIVPEPASLALLGLGGLGLLRRRRC